MRKGMRLAVEAMVRIGETINVTQREVAQGKYTALQPIEIQYAEGVGQNWKTLDPLQSQIKIPWLGKKNDWQSIKTPYVLIPQALSVKAVRLILRNYAFRRDGSEQPREYPTSFDEIKVLASSLR